jgi:hypothetical protein
MARTDVVSVHTAKSLLYIDTYIYIYIYIY